MNAKEFLKQEKITESCFQDHGVLEVIARLIEAYHKQKTAWVKCEDGLQEEVDRLAEEFTSRNGFNSFYNNSYLFALNTYVSEKMNKDITEFYFEYTAHNESYCLKIIKP